MTESNKGSADVCHGLLHICAYCCKNIGETSVKKFFVSKPEISKVIQIQFHAVK